MEQLSVSGREYTVLKLLGKGKGGYYYLVLDGNQKVDMLRNMRNKSNRLQYKAWKRLYEYFTTE